MNIRTLITVVGLIPMPAALAVGPQKCTIEGHFARFVGNTQEHLFVNGDWAFMRVYASIDPSDRLDDRNHRQIRAQSFRVVVTDLPNEELYHFDLIDQQGEVAFSGFTYACDPGDHFDQATTGHWRRLPMGGNPSKSKLQLDRWDPANNR
ncbi:hypothetical protein UB46_12920 [Burkholderiaceae bacterium 16]|nr:hypothetical protein UB46_12920 [Burkholderiaceae bacterium 16]